MKIAIIGAPHSGKTVFTNWIMSMLPMEGCSVVAANPDGEGSWSNSPDVEEVQRVRLKGKYNKAFMAATDAELDAHDERITFVDLGGKLNGVEEGKPTLTVENAHLLAQCDAYIVLSSDRGLMDIWERLASQIINTKQKRLICLAKIDSTMDPNLGSAAVAQKGEQTFKARLFNLSRGTKNRQEAKPVLRRLAMHFLRASQMDAKERMHFDVDGLDITQDLLEMGVILDKSKTEVPDCIEGHNKRAFIPKEFFPHFEEYLRKKLSYDGASQIPEEVTLGYMPNNHSTVAICDALYKIGVKRILIYDAAFGKCVPIPRVKEMETREISSAHEGLVTQANLIESKESVFLNIDKYGKNITEDIVRYGFIIPEVIDDKTLYISGKLPYHLLVGICLSSGAKKIYTYTPGVGFVCVKSDNPEELGTSKKEIEEIDTDSFFEDRKGGLDENGNPRVVKENYMYVKPEHRIESEKNLDASTQEGFVERSYSLKRSPRRASQKSVKGPKPASGKSKRKGKKNPEEMLTKSRYAKLKELMDSLKKARDMDKK